MFSSIRMYRECFGQVVQCIFTKYSVIPVTMLGNDYNSNYKTLYLYSVKFQARLWFFRHSHVYCVLDQTATWNLGYHWRHGRKISKTLSAGFWSKTHYTRDIQEQKSFFLNKDDHICKELDCKSKEFSHHLSPRDLVCTQKDFKPKSHLFGLSTFFPPRGNYANVAKNNTYKKKIVEL